MKDIPRRERISGCCALYSGIPPPLCRSGWYGYSTVSARRSTTGRARRRILSKLSLGIPYGKAPANHAARGICCPQTPETYHMFQSCGIPSQQPYVVDNVRQSLATSRSASRLGCNRQGQGVWLVVVPTVTRPHLLALVRTDSCSSTLQPGHRHRHGHGHGCLVAFGLRAHVSCNTWLKGTLVT